MPRPPKTLCPCGKFWKTKSGLCGNCRQREYQRRKRNGIREDRKEEELGFGHIPPVS